MSSYGTIADWTTIRPAVLAVAAFGLCGCGSTSSAGSVLGAVSGAADIVSLGAKITVLGGGFGGSETLGMDLDRMATAVDVMEAADEVSDTADDAAAVVDAVEPLLQLPQTTD